jgi:pSer/pThr/pTyr-binding forkhead associated (FHA) protein
MPTGCPRCGDPPHVGVLCRACAAAVPVPDGLIPDHVTSRLPRGDAAGWLVDGFGAAHAVGATRTLIGRRPQADVVVLSSSVSRDHAELHRVDGGWQIRDLGSRNGTTVDGARIQGRAPVPERATLRIGDVAFLFVGRPAALPDAGERSLETAHAGNGTFRFTLRGPSLDLCLLGAPSVDADTGGALLYRDTAGTAWSELSLPPLEFHLLRALCARAIADGTSPSRSRGCVPTKQLARDLPFQSRYANEENVRQVVRRLRATLVRIGADALVEALPGRGYYVAWPVVDT